MANEHWQGGNVFHQCSNQSILTFDLSITENPLIFYKTSTPPMLETVLVQI